MITLKIDNYEKQFNKQLLISKSKYFDTLFNNCSDIPNVIDLSRFQPKCLDILEEYVNNPKYDNMPLEEERPLFVFEYQKANIPYWKIPEILEASTQYGEYSGIIPMRYRYDRFRNLEFSKYEKIMCIKGGLYEFSDYFGIQLIQQICALYHLSSLERNILPEFCAHYMSLYIPWPNHKIAEIYYENQIYYPGNEYDFSGHNRCEHKCLAAYIYDLNDYIIHELNNSETETLVIEHVSTFQNITGQCRYIKNIISFDNNNSIGIPSQAKNVICNGGFMFGAKNYELDLFYFTNSFGGIHDIDNNINLKVGNCILNNNEKMLTYNGSCNLSAIDCNTLNVIFKRNTINPIYTGIMGKHKEVNMYVDWNPTNYTLDGISKILIYVKKCRSSKYYKSFETNLTESDEIKYTNMLKLNYF
jgi:hypothetical protein